MFKGDILIIITDDNDEPTVGFEKPVYEVVEPAEGQIQRLRICVIRTGDLTAEMEGRVHTKVNLKTLVIFNEVNKGRQRREWSRLCANLKDNHH